MIGPRVFRRRAGAALPPGRSAPHLTSDITLIGLGLFAMTTFVVLCAAVSLRWLAPDPWLPGAFFCLMSYGVVLGIAVGR